MRIYCKDGGVYAQAVYDTPAGSRCSNCAVHVDAINFWGRHEVDGGEIIPPRPSKPTMAAQLAGFVTRLEEERRRHGSTAAQLHDARELLNQQNKELADLGNENHRLRVELAKLRRGRVEQITQGMEDDYFNLLIRDDEP